MAERAELVLVGGGHAHVHVLKVLGMRPALAVRITLVTNALETPYSGMLPGLVAGSYGVDEAMIDLMPLARFAGARLIRATACGIDRQGRRLLLRDRPSIPYTLLSLDIGSLPPTGDVPGASAHALPVKPVDRFLARWAALTAAAGPGGPRLAVVGGGAAGVEMALALRARMVADGLGTPPMTLLTRGGLLPSFAAGARTRLAAALNDNCITVVENAGVVAVEPDAVQLADGQRIPCDGAVWATGSGAPGWLADTGLTLDGAGFIMVDRTLRSLNDHAIFAAGDIAGIRDTVREKAGVFAVRQGPPLAENLRRALAGRRLKPHHPQRDFLRLVGTGDGRAVAARGGFSAAGAWVWHWKDRIDRRWMRRYRDLPPMTAAAPVAAATDPIRCAGCGAKLPGGVLGRALARLGIDPAAGDDAAVLDPPPGGPLVQTVDMFRSPVDDPYLAGRIAAVHALGDIHAMGARPLIALAIAGLPHGDAAAQEEDLHQMLAGAAAELAQAGATLAGGHSAEMGEMALGLTITGAADGRPLLRKGGLSPGDRLVLTKPLGTGVLLAAAMRGRGRGRYVEGALDGMLQSGGAAADILRDHGATACTDVTGFGLAGHLTEMLRASGCGAVLDLSSLPVLPGALGALEAGIESTLAPANRDLSAVVVTGGDPARLALLADPQTAGGLLAGIPADRAAACVAALQALGYAQVAIIGAAVASPDGSAGIRLA